MQWYQITILSGNFSKYNNYNSKNNIIFPELELEWRNSGVFEQKAIVQEKGDNAVC